MKRKLFVLLTLFATFLSQAQEPSAPDSQAPVSSSDSLVIQNLIQRLEALEATTGTQSTSINALMSGIVLADKSKYEVIKNNLINGRHGLETLNDKLNLIQNNVADASIWTYINNLSNPQGSELGFKLEDKLVDLIKKDINPTKKNVADKIFESINGISKSPIVNGIPAFSPALSISNSVISVLRSTSILDKSLEENKIKNFENSLSKYVDFYVALNNANIFYNTALQIQKEKSNSLHQRLLEESIKYLKGTNCEIPVRTAQQSTGTYLNEVFNSFNQRFINYYFINLENKNTTDNTIRYPTIIANNHILKEMNNSVSDFIFLLDEYVNQVNAYQSMRDMYFSKVIDALELAEKNGISSSSIISQQKAKFSYLKNESISLFDAAVNIPNLVSIKNSIRYKVTVL